MAQLARLFRERGTSPEDYLKRLVAAPAPPTFPTRRILDPDRREDAVAAKHADAPAKAFEKRMRSVRTTRPYVDPSTALREQYTNDDGALVCQICKETMPFRKRNGEYYAEAVESLSKKHFLKDDEAQFLLLCPVCAAKYTEFIKHDDSVMERLKAQLADNDAPEVSLRLGEEDASLRFVETHRLDIRTILKLNTASQ
jgi:hypothetical protein